MLNHLDLFYQQVTEVRHDFEKPQVLRGSCCAFGVFEAESTIRDVVSVLAQDGVRTVESRMEQLCERIEAKATDGKTFLWRVLFSVKEFLNVYLSQSYIENVLGFYLVRPFCSWLPLLAPAYCFYLYIFGLFCVCMIFLRFSSILRSMITNQ